MNGPCDRTRMRIKLRIKGRARLRSPLFPSVLSRDFSPIILRFRFVFQIYRVIDRFRESGSREREGEVSADDFSPIIARSFVKR